MNRVLIGLLLVGALTACGGGSSSSTPATQTTATPTAMPTNSGPSGPSSQSTAPPLPATGTPTGNLASNATQQSIATEGLAADSETNTIISLANSGGDSSISKMRRAAEQLMKNYRKGPRTLARVRPLATPSIGPCVSGIEENKVAGPGANEEQLTEYVFYDTACTQIEEEAFEDIVATSQTVATENATISIFSTTGTQTGYIVQVINLTSPSSGTEDATITQAISTTNGSAVYSNVGASCGVTSSTVDCGAGSIVHGATADSGISLLFNATFSDAALNFSGSDELYTGAANKLTLAQGTFPAWSVGGGSQSASATVSANLTDSTDAVITLTDAANGGTLTLTQYELPTPITLGILTATNGGTVAATFSINSIGDGTINYSNGTTATIANFVIQP